MARLADDPLTSQTSLNLPYTLMRGVPPSISGQAIRTINDVGAEADVMPSPPTTLGWVRGGELIAYEDDVIGPQMTTLPPLHALAANVPRRRMRALLGGINPDSRTSAHACCGRSMRTVARLLGDDQPAPSGVRLGPAAVYVCIKCGNGTLHRFGVDG